MERDLRNTPEPPVTRRSLRDAPPAGAVRARSGAGPITRRDLRQPAPRPGPAVVAGRVLRLAAPPPRPGRHSRPRSRHVATNGPGSWPGIALAASVVALTLAIGGVHSDLTLRQELQAEQSRSELRTRIDQASATRLSAQGEHYAAARHAVALEAAIAAVNDAGPVVVVAAGIVDAEAVSPLDEAVAELLALVEVTAPAALAEPGVTGPAALAEPGAADGGLIATSAPRGVTPDIEPVAPVASSAGSPTAAPDLQVSDRMLELAAQVSELTEQVRTLTDEALLEIAAAEAAAAEQRAAEIARRIAAVDASRNGAVPHKLMCGVGFTSGVLLRCDAAAALEELNGAFRSKFGRDLAVSSSYRDYSTQVATKESRGSLAADPGTSNHGRGLAVDFDGFGAVGQFDRPYYLWMRDNGPRFGWMHPPYMGPGGSGPLEPWHWEYGTG